MMLSCSVPDGSRWSLLMAAAFATASCSGLSIDESLRSGTTMLDAGEVQGALRHFIDAEDLAEGDHDWAYAVALQVEAHLRAQDLDAAGATAARLRERVPRCFITWKAAATLALRRGDLGAARDCTQAASALAPDPGCRLWVKDFRSLLDAVAAFHAGDLGGAAARLRDVRHADVAPGAAYLRARIEAIQGLQQQREVSMVRRGIEDGLRDVWSTAAPGGPLLRRIEDFVHAHGAELAGFSLDETDRSPPGTRLFAASMGVHSVGLRADLAVAEVPARLREDR